MAVQRGAKVAAEFSKRFKQLTHQVSIYMHTCNYSVYRPPLGIKISIPSSLLLLSCTVSVNGIVVIVTNETIDLEARNIISLKGFYFYLKSRPDS